MLDAIIPVIPSIIPLIDLFLHSLIAIIPNTTAHIPICIPIIMSGKKHSTAEKETDTMPKTNDTCANISFFIT